MERRNWSLLVLAVMLVGLTSPEAGGAEAKTVSVVVDYGDGVQKHIHAIAWESEMTVLDAMTTADKHPRGLSLEYRGRGANSLLIRIDDLKNEGQGRNWIYRVNDKKADRGVGAYRLEAGDTVLWRFEKYR